jgi:TM2 domain-containing membrane protein YozV
MKNKTTAGVLALFLGGLGAHKFYFGQWILGLLYLVFAVTLIPAILGVIEGLNFFFMSEARFQEKFANRGTILMTPSGPIVATPETHVKCPDCRELVRRDARRCKHCGCALTPQ